MVDFTDLLWPGGVQNPGGLTQRAYLCPADDIDFTTPPTLEADGVTISGDLVCKTGKKFIVVYITQDKGKWDSPTQGEIDGKSKKTSFEFFFPGSQKSVVAFERDAINTKWVALMESKDGTMRVLGIYVTQAGNLSLALPANMEMADSTSGGAAADLQGTTFKLSCDAPFSPLFYEGDVQLIATP